MQIGLRLAEVFAENEPVDQSLISSNRGCRGDGLSPRVLMAVQLSRPALDQNRIKNEPRKKSWRTSTTTFHSESCAIHTCAFRKNLDHGSQQDLIRLWAFFCF